MRRGRYGMKGATIFAGRIMIAAILALALGASGASAAGEKKRLAVLDFSANNTSDANARIVRNAFEVMMYKTSLYSILERKQVELVLKEQGFQSTGCVDTACAVEIGKMLSADLAAVGSLDRIDTYIVSVKIVDIRDGSVVYADNERSANESGLYNALETLVARYSGRASTPETGPAKNNWELMKEWFDAAEKLIPDRKEEQGGWDPSWYVGTTDGYTRIGGHHANLTGGRGGILLTDGLWIGASGMGLTYPTRRETFAGKPYDGRYTGVEAGWGGVLVEYFMFPRERFQFSFGLTVGAGGVGYVSNDENDDSTESGSAFFLMEPEAGAYVSFLRYFRLGMLASYRYTLGSNTPNLRDSDLRSFGVAFVLQFVWN